ncbi:hypothetical protein F4561_003121 [Lipingzhangella halophila]|uniref:Protein kinase domain-containing protein n=1 Tax=Lipingzhangella halophila TaxID=1783352 RepID=A0A7W7RHV7_9ACTN|nr:serine/threonine-protein kinase [Lipingzhangella halophila]MBB4932301.1 hypothetical protein [Lipingzhangella halophila]
MGHPQIPSGITPRLETDPRQIGAYRIAGRIGAGGMGVVYAGVDDSGRAVAVKVVKRELAADPEFRARFAREVDLLRRVRGTCLPAFFGADTDADTPWLASEYVNGPTLRQYLDRHGPMDPAMLIGFAAGCAEALAAVHHAGIVHRDLKPGNVLLASDGPKVLDFGIARAVDESAITRTGGLMGTPGWVAPEQYDGTPPHPTSDMFAWGGLVAYAGTGRAPFGTGNAKVLAQRVLHEEPDLDGLPEELVPLVRAALGKTPDQRPTAAQALRGATVLAPWSADEEPTQVLSQVLHSGWRVEPESGPDAWAPLLPRPPWWRRTATVVTAAALALVLVVSGSWVAGRYWAQNGDPEETGDTAGAAQDADAGTQEVTYHDLTLDVPEEWQAHEYEVDYTGTVPVGSSDSEEILVLQTDPSQSCELGSDFLISPQCASVWLLGPVSRHFGYAGDAVDETRHFHIAGEPTECVRGLDVYGEPRAEDPADSESLGLLDEEELDLDGASVLHQTWEVGCLADYDADIPEESYRYHEQRMWRLPEAMVVDNYQTESLAEIMEDAQVTQ